MSDIFSQIELGKLFHHDYLFEVTPATEGLYQYLTILFVLMVLGAIVLRLFAKPKNSLEKKLRDKIFYLLLSIGIISLLYSALRFENIPYIGSRFVEMIILIGAIFWIGKILFYRYLIMPKKIRQINEEERFKKYLPHRKEK